MNLTKAKACLNYHIHGRRDAIIDDLNDFDFYVLQAQRNILETVMAFIDEGDERQKALEQATATLIQEGIVLDADYSKFCERVLYGDMLLEDLIAATRYKANVLSEGRKLDFWEAWLFIRERKKV